MKYWTVLGALLGIAACAGERITELGGGRYHLAIRSEYGEAEDRAVERLSASARSRNSQHP